MNWMFHINWIEKASTPLWILFAVYTLLQLGQLLTARKKRAYCIYMSMLLLLTLLHLLYINYTSAGWSLLVGNLATLLTSSLLIYAISRFQFKKALSFIPQLAWNGIVLIYIVLTI